MADVDGAHADAVEQGWPIVRELRDEPWGVRPFLGRDPAGRVVNIAGHR